MHALLLPGWCRSHRAVLQGWCQSHRTVLHVCTAGLVPEDLLRLLIANRVDYHFARICHHTDQMMGIFRGVYKEAPPGAAVFEEHVSTPGISLPGLLWYCWARAPVHAARSCPL